ncbi:MAG: DUF481 domain-containing protein [Thiomargarita sp.]|nr:DUF481 domain-containing protein [Thiomargarita sp.]
MKNQLRNTCAILLASFVTTASATEGEELGWNGEGEFGFTSTTGNTETQSLIAKMDLGYKLTSWNHNFKLDALRAEDDNNITAERYGIKLQSDYFMSLNTAMFGKLRYEEDHFGSYDHQSSLILGVQYHAINNTRTRLRLELGAGMSQNELELTEFDTDTQEGFIGYAGLKFSQKIGAHSEFIQNIEVEGGSENVYVESDTGFKVNIMENLALKVSLLVKYNSEVAPATNAVPATEASPGIEAVSGREAIPEKKNIDTMTAVTLVYNF